MNCHILKEILDQFRTLPIVETAADARMYKVATLALPTIFDYISWDDLLALMDYFVSSYYRYNLVLLALQFAKMEGPIDPYFGQIIGKIDDASFGKLFAICTLEKYIGGTLTATDVLGCLSGMRGEHKLEAMNILCVRMTDTEKTIFVQRQTITDLENMLKSVPDIALQNFLMSLQHHQYQELARFTDPDLLLRFIKIVEALGQNQPLSPYAEVDAFINYSVVQAQRPV